ncbi:TRAP transporter small permease subunit [Futiania mangrovi]|uniref:TRAP transporter small permease protein n=1 Tax=Futiania mangrovi TaxID=2959716 RepID=A0A9J6PAG0_9PROT|nr:TRAP transporter small permease subunit [Futiania mangrovii]MCP1335014.1 TRAP transporter small permease subunit [Futiania mangrovii]
MPFLMRVSEALEAFLQAIGRVASFLFIPLMIVIFYDVTQRKILEYDHDFTSSVFYFSSTKMQEMEWHIHAVLFLLCLAYAYLKDAHVRIELVRDQMHPRTRAWIELIGCLIFLIPYCILVTDYGYTFAERAFLSGESSASGVGLSHRWIVKGALPLGFLLLGLAGLAVALRSLVYLFGSEDLRARARSHVGVHHADDPNRPVAD